MKIYLVRHGQTSHNALKVYSSEDQDLNEVGIKQANELKNKIKEIDYNIVIVSPLKRTIHTSNIINVKNKKVIIDERLKERSVGDLSGKPLSVTNRDEYWNYNTKLIWYK